MRRYGGGGENIKKSVWNIYMVIKIVFWITQIALNIEDVSGLE
jgi:hypothetical protein